MGLDETMIVAGVGCRRGAPAADIEAAIRAALERAGVPAHALEAIATIAAKQSEAGIQAVAELLGVSFVVVSDSDLRSASDRTKTQSARVLEMTGVGSVAEAAALAAAGSSARLISPRLVGAATCALAASETQQ